MGVFFGASLLGNAISPVVGGWGAKYSSWLNVQLGLFFVGLFVAHTPSGNVPSWYHGNGQSRAGTRGRWRAIKFSVQMGLVKSIFVYGSFAAQICCWSISRA
ncbi:hypothetical protein FB451DRAFT_211729 [Mycena latifolia]|nr:hypothetical protein FB451DRAFT_211729 [Mycena latifolia]